MRRLTRFMLVLAGVTWLAMPKPSLAQSFNPLFPPLSNQSITAYCYDEVTGQVIPFCNVYMQPVIWLYTNSHYHHSDSHPYSLPYPASGNTGCCGLPVTITTSIVGQAEAMWACPVGGGRCGGLNFGVGYDLFFVGETEFWYLVGATANHGTVYENHWATGRLYDGIYGAARDFLQNHPEVGRVALNDMALPYGGKFDLLSNWTSPHAEHDRGTAVDINGVPFEFANEFVQSCYNNRASRAAVEFDPYHVHCIW